MATNISRYREDLEKLIAQGVRLENSIQYETMPDEFLKELKKTHGKNSSALIEKLPSFMRSYQAWYSEAKALVRQLLPDRSEDFSKHYEVPKGRKAVNFTSYRIEDCLQGVSVRDYMGVETVGPSAAIPHFRQQMAITHAVRARFESSLFDIRQLVQADLLDSELDAARELSNRGFTRAAGAVAGVVLERHLAQTCLNHIVSLAKKKPTISNLNDALKDAEVLDTTTWRFIQHLGDIRNSCDHVNNTEPKRESVDDLIAGVAKITKTLF